MAYWYEHKKRDSIFILITGCITLVLFLLPTGYENSYHSGASVRTSARVLEVDNALVKTIGPVKEGEQQLVIQIRTGKYSGQVFHSANLLMGKLEIDKFFVPGDTVFTVLDLDESQEKVLYANVIDHYRTGKTIVLILLFFGVLYLVAGWVGLKAIISFIFSGMVLCKVLLPLILRGWNPVGITIITVCVLTAVIIYLVGGITGKGSTAFAGSMGGVIITALFSWLFTCQFKIHGAVRPFTETLLYTGYGHLDLVQLFISGVFLASSGAVMDLAMDIAAAMDEVFQKHPEITRAALIRSGLTVGRHAVGTMSTTLLLAYSGGYTGMMLTFIARGVPLENIINMVYVSSELVHTLVGSFGLVLTAPLTAIAGGVILVPGIKKSSIKV